MGKSTEELVGRLSDIFADELAGGLDGFCFDRQLDWKVLEICRAVGRATIEKSVAMWGRQFEARGYEVQRRRMVKVHTVLGRVDVVSPYFVATNGDGPGIRPVSDTLGLHANRATERLRRLVTDFGVERSFAASSAALLEHHGVTLGATSVRTIVLAEGASAEVYVDERLEKQAVVPRSKQAAMVLVEADGAHIPTVSYRDLTAAEEKANPDAKRKRTIEWKEVRTGKARAEGSVTGFFTSGRQTLDEIASNLTSLARRAGRGVDTEVVAVGDGGNGLKEAILREFTESTYVLDRMHLRSHLHDGAKALGIAKSDEQAWVDRIDSLIGAGELEVVCAEVESGRAEVEGLHLEILRERDPVIRKRLEPVRQRHQANATRLQALLDYFERFADSVSYDQFQARGWPIGSGEIESAHRQIPQPRLKRPGVAFTPTNVDRVLALRILRANDDWSDYWQKRAA